MESILFGMGNPLLDISAFCDQSFLQKYGLKANDAILAEDKHKPMYADMIETFEHIDYIPGGATLNAIKVAQWIIDVPKATTFMGCVGKDRFGEIMKDKITELNVNARFQYTDKEPTGTCAVLVSGEEKNRSLCAYLAAANLFSKDHLDVAEHWSLIEAAKFYYIASFVLTVAPDAMVHVAEHAMKTNKTFMLNLSAPFLCQFFKEPMMRVMPYVDILFGNETEAATFGAEQNFQTADIKEIALRTAALPKKNSSRSRTVVFTQGSDSVIVAKDGKITEFPVPAIDAAKVIDTNGAGDAFVGGFLSQLVQGRPLSECIRCANAAAQTIIQRIGCTFPEKPDFV